MASGPNVAANLNEAKRLIGMAVEQGARLVALPEYFGIMGMKDHDKVKVREEEGKGPIQQFLSETAEKHKIWLVGGSVPLASDDANKVRNASLVYNDKGKLVARYDKIHLFGFEMGKEHYFEERTIEPGRDVRVIDSPFGRIGLSICYDLRFPELYRSLALAGAEVLTVPSNFTERTGRDHWEVLLRARAIENGAWVLAPSQIGGPPGSPAFGRSMIIDPWGTVVAQAGDSVGIIRTDVETDRVAAVRRQIPVLANRRPAAYRGVEV